MLDYQEAIQFKLCASSGKRIALSEFAVVCQSDGSESPIQVVRSRATARDVKPDVKPDIKPKVAGYRYATQHETLDDDWENEVEVMGANQGDTL